VVPDDKDALISGFRYFAGLSKEDLERMGEKSREYAMAHLTRKTNLSMVINSIKHGLQ
jgi:hypothetical protein